ncbi:FkbM family methyltransferase [Nostoc sp.]|uniref:FkbM family methyltransferase n=1 Tax=Nostoc sp. TaxID=1180 RepID=UPI002FF7216D
MNIVKSTKALILKFFRFMGYELYQIEHKIRQEKQKTLWLENYGIKTVIDVGANEGQFTRYINKILPMATIYSFEPLSDCHEKLVANCSSINNFHSFNIALGDISGKININRCNFSPSSSLLSMSKLHEEAFPFTKGISIEEEINIYRLDEIAEQMVLEEPILIKLDVQGFEDKVISGGIQTIKKADILIIELSLEMLYEGQLLFDDIYKILTNLGFKYQGNLEQLHSTVDGKVVQSDGIFVKYNNQ